MAHQRQLSPKVVLDKMKRIYYPMSILVRKEQEKYFFRLKTAVNYGTVKSQAGAKFSRFEVSSLEGFFFRSQQLPYKIVYTCIDVISSEEDTTKNAKHPCPNETHCGPIKMID